jgi:hypothetical protein
MVAILRGSEHCRCHHVAMSMQAAANACHCASTPACHTAPSPSCRRAPTLQSCCHTADATTAAAEPRRIILPKLSHRNPARVLGHTDGVAPHHRPHTQTSATHAPCHPNATAVLMPTPMPLPPDRRHPTISPHAAMPPHAVMTNAGTRVALDAVATLCLCHCQWRRQAGSALSPHYLPAVATPR